ASWTSPAAPGAVAANAAAESNEADMPLARRRAMVSRGLLERQSKERVVTIRVHETGRHVVVQGADRHVDVYKVRTQAELRRRLARLKSRRKEKKTVADAMDTVEGAEVALAATDEIPRVGGIRCEGKIRSVDVSPRARAAPQSAPDAFYVLCALSSNQLEVHLAGIDSKDAPTRHELTVDMHGHRGDVRTLALSSDDQLLLSGSNAAVKVWNLASRQCVATLASGYALCSAFVPGNNHAVVGTKAGDIEIYDLASSTLLETIKGAHTGAIWSLQVWPDRKGITTGSADKDVKFWEFALKEVDDDDGKAGGAGSGGRRRVLTLHHTRTLKLSEDVLGVCHSRDGRLLAVSLLDCTVKVFYADSLAFFLSLYGHKLPVLAMDMSADGDLIATASADKTLKIWGLDFGDCHRSLLAHEDSVMCARFVGDTHYVVTASKDKTVKYWDADKFQQIMKMEGHQGEVWALAVSKHGEFIVSGSHDRSIRIWKKTDIQV
ncbi:hypothetical protein HK405_014526, partial [Cladochytrium tenue]